MNILIVDDDSDDREVFCEIVKEVEPAANCIVQESAESALDFLSKEEIDINYIFLDVFMGNIDGKECLLKMKTIDKINNVPVFIYSGLDDPQQAELYKKLGASDYITKPSSIEGLRDIIVSILK